MTEIPETIASPPEPAPPPDAPAQGGIRRPADYYAAPVSDIRPLFPRWVPAGCGIASAVLLVIVFAGGALILHFGLGLVMDKVLGMVQGELGTYYAKEVTPPARKALEAELKALRANVRSGAVPVPKVRPVMLELQGDIDDTRLTAAETERLTKVIHDTNAGAKKK